MVCQPLELSDPPRRPRPELGRDHMHNLGALGLHDGADREVGRGRIDGYMNRDRVGLDPLLDPCVYLSVLADLVEPGHPHDRVISSVLNDLGSRRVHLPPAPCDDP